MLGLKFNPFRSITFKGALLAVGGYLWTHFDPSSLGQNGGTIVEAIGAIISIVGVRNAQAKTGAAINARVSTAAGGGSMFCANCGHVHYSKELCSVCTCKDGPEA